MSPTDQSSDTSYSPLTALRRVDARIGKWGYGVSGWAGVFVGAVSALLAEDVVELLSLTATPLPAVFAEPLVLLVLMYSLLGVAYAYRQRFAGPTCRF